MGSSFRGFRSRLGGRVVDAVGPQVAECRLLEGAVAAGGKAVPGVDVAHQRLPAGGVLGTGGRVGDADRVGGLVPDDVHALRFAEAAAGRPVVAVDVGVAAVGGAAEAACAGEGPVGVVGVGLGDPADGDGVAGRAGADLGGDDAGRHGDLHAEEGGEFGGGVLQVGGELGAGGRVVEGDAPWPGVDVGDAGGCELPAVAGD